METPGWLPRSPRILDMPQVMFRVVEARLVGGIFLWQLSPFRFIFFPMLMNFADAVRNAGKKGGNVASARLSLNP